MNIHRQVCVDVCLLLPWCICRRKPLLAYMIIPCLTFWGIIRLFSEWFRCFIMSPQYTRIPVSLQLCQGLFFVFFCFFFFYCFLFCFFIAILVGVMWYLMWFLFAFPQWLMMLSIFSCAFWWCVYLLWRHVYSNPLPGFKLGFCFYCWDVSVLHIF